MFSMRSTLLLAGKRPAAACMVVLGLTFGLVATSSASEPKFHLQEATIAQIQQAILRKQLTTEQLVELYLKRIKAYNGTCVKQPQGILGPIETIPNAGQINALVDAEPAPGHAQGVGLRRAQGAQHDRSGRTAIRACRTRSKSRPRRMREFAQTGKLVGPLHGVVMAIKDQYDTFDMRTTSGADAFYANDRPPDDATFVERLREAGRDHPGEGELGEYASACRAARSAARSAIRTTRSAARAARARARGSSVGANLVTCAIAEETGSSIRGPASADKRRRHRRRRKSS